MDPFDWHYVGFGIIHQGPRDQCDTCVLSQQMAVAAWNDWYGESFFGATP